MGLGCRIVEAGLVVCTYELLRDEVVVSTGQLTLEKVPGVGEVIRLGGTRAEVVEVLPGPRLRLRG